MSGKGDCKVKRFLSRSPSANFYQLSFWGEIRSPTKIDKSEQKSGTLILSSLEDLAVPA